MIPTVLADRSRSTKLGVVIILVGLLAVATFAACGGNGDSGEAWTATSSAGQATTSPSPSSAGATPESIPKGTEPAGMIRALPIPDKGELKYPNLGSRLDGLVASVEAEQATAEEAARDAAMHSGASVAVTIHVSGNADEVAAFLKANGGDPRNVGEDYVEAYVPVTLLGPVSEQPGVLRVREIVPPEDEGSG